MQVATGEGRHEVTAARSEEVMRVVTWVLTRYPAAKQWPAKPLRALLAGSRETALNEAYALGVTDGAIAMQEWLDADPSRIGPAAELFWAQAMIMPVLPSPATALDLDAFGDEGWAAGERYSSGFGLATGAMLMTRSGGPNKGRASGGAGTAGAAKDGHIAWE